MDTGGMVDRRARQAYDQPQRYWRLAE